MYLLPNIQELTSMWLWWSVRPICASLSASRQVSQWPQTYWCQEEHFGTSFWRNVSLIFIIFFYIKSAKREFVTVSWTVIDANDIWSTTVTVCVYLVLWDSEKRKPRITCMFSKGFFQGAWVVFEDNIINIEGLFWAKKFPFLKGDFIVMKSEKFFIRKCSLRLFCCC